MSIGAAKNGFAVRESCGARRCGGPARERRGTRRTRRRGGGEAPPPRPRREVCSECPYCSTRPEGVPKGCARGPGGRCGGPPQGVGTGGPRMPDDPAVVVVGVWVGGDRGETDPRICALGLRARVASCADKQRQSPLVPVFPDRSRLSATDQSHVLWLDLLVNSRPSKWKFRPFQNSITTGLERVQSDVVLEKTHKCASLRSRTW